MPMSSITFSKASLANPGKNLAKQALFTTSYTFSSGNRCCLLAIGKRTKNIIEIGVIFDPVQLAIFFNRICLIENRAIWAILALIHLCNFEFRIIKVEKKCNFQSAKTHFLQFQKWQKNQFLHQKKVQNYQKCNF